MSHFTRIKTELRERAHLLTALDAMGYADVRMGDTVRGWRGREESADVVAHRSNGYDIGFVRRGRSYEIVADWYGIDLDRDDLVRTLTQEYALAAAEEAARKARWTNIQRERLPDGSVVVTGERPLGHAGGGW